MKERQKKRNFFNQQFFSQKNCKGIISEYLPWLLLAIATLAVVMIIIFALKNQGNSLIDQIKNLFR